MGTNYYLQTDACPTCGHAKEERHIGKSSHGWCFSLRVYPEEGINDLDDWDKLFAQPNTSIRDEYGNKVTVEELSLVIRERSKKTDWNKKPAYYESWETLLVLNNAVKGPNGLLRSVVDGKHCIKHGEGTWDCIVGEFC